MLFLMSFIFFIIFININFNDKIIYFQHVATSNKGLFKGALSINFSSASFAFLICIYKNNKEYKGYQEEHIDFSWGSTSKKLKPINKIKNNKFYINIFYYLYLFISINHLITF